MEPQRFLPQNGQEILPNLELNQPPSNLESMNFDLGQPDPLKSIDFNSPKQTSIIPFHDPQIGGFDFLSSNFYLSL